MSVKFQNFCWIGKDPEILPFPVNGKADSLCNLYLYFEEIKGDIKSSSYSNTIVQFNAAISGEMAELASRLLKKGSRIFVYGKLSNYVDKTNSIKHVLLIERFYIDPRDVDIMLEQAAKNIHTKKSNQTTFSKQADNRIVANEQAYPE